MASPSFAGTAVTGGNSSGTSLVLNKPSSSAVDEILFAALTLENADTITAPAGFTNILAATQSGAPTAYQFNAWWRRVDGTEGASFTWSWTNSNHRSGFICRLSGAVTGIAPLEASQDIVTAGSASTSPATSGISPVTAETLLLLAQADTGANGTVSGGPTERVDFNRVYFATEALAAAGATGSRTITIGSSQWWVLGAFALMSVAPAYALPPRRAGHRFSHLLVR